MRPPPQVKGSVTEDDIMSFLPDMNSTCRVLTSLTLLSQPALDFVRLHPSTPTKLNKQEVPNHHPRKTVKVHLSPCRFLCATTERWYSDRAPTAGWWRRCRLTSSPYLMTSQIETVSLICRILTCARDALKIVFPSESPTIK